MKTLSGKIIKFFRKQNFVIVSTVSRAGHPRHPEILFPNPRYMIVMDVEEIIDLTAANAPGMPGDTGFLQSSTELRATSAVLARPIKRGGQVSIRRIVP